MNGNILTILLIGFIVSLIIAILFYALLYGLSKVFGWKFGKRERYNLGITLIIIFIINSMGTVLRGYGIAQKTIALMYLMILLLSLPILVLCIIKKRNK